MKKLLSVVLALVFCFGIVIPAFASQASASNILDESISTSLSHVEPHKDNMGLSGVDFTNLDIGEEIKMYEYTESGFTELRSCYPIFHQYVLVALAIDIGNGLYQISTNIAPEIDALSLDDIAIVYDNIGAYAFDGEQFHLLVQNFEEVEGRLNLSEATTNLDVSALVTASLNPCRALSYTAAASTNSNARSNTMATCYIDLISQSPYENLCWAAVIASIVNYRNDVHLTTYSVARGRMVADGLTNVDTTLPHSDVPSILNTYGVTGYTYQSSVPNVTVIYNNLYQGYPIYGIFFYGSFVEHAVTIYFVNILDGYIMVMDPQLDEFQICNYANGNFSYFRSDLGVTLTLRRAVCRYWS